MGRGLGIQALLGFVARPSLASVGTKSEAAAEKMWSSPGAKCGPFRAGRRIVLFLVFTRGQSVLIQPVDKAAAGFL